MRTYDALIIGFGKGGKTLAGALAAAGRKVAVVERSERMYGGTCINVACIPTKSLVNSAGLSAAMGGTFQEKAVRYAEAIDEKDRLTTMLRGKNYHKLADNPQVDVILGTASFVDGHHVRVVLGDESTVVRAGADAGKAVDAPSESVEYIEARQIFINTGSRPIVPPIPGLDRSKHAYVSETMLDCRELPRDLVIVGGGYIGMEFASMYANFGSRVTVVQDSDVFLPREDDEVAHEVLASLEKRGVTVLRSAKVQSVEDDSLSTAVTVEVDGVRKELHADAVLVATGRKPETTDLNLVAAGIETTPRGAVKVDERLQTTAKDIWAMGDVAGGLQFTYVSLDDYRIVKSQVLEEGGRTTANRGEVPYSVFLDPPFSRVGITEKEAREKGLSIKVAKLPAAAIPKAQVLKKPVGLLKAIVDSNTNLILGAHLFCEESYEMINIIKLAMDARIPYTQLRDAIYTHPTMSEGLNDLFAGI